MYVRHTLFSAMAAPTKLIYFPVRARAEAIRMCFAHGNVPFEDHSVQSFFDGKSWPEVKPTLPFDQLPALCIDGKILCQSGACTRYAARMAGCVPEDPLEAAHCDMIFEAAQELAACNPIVNVFRGETFAAKKAEFFSTFPRKLENLSAQLAARSGPFFCGEVPSYADFAVYHQLDLCQLLEPGCCDAHANIAPFMAAVKALPGVSEYLARRPVPVDIGTAPVLRPTEPPAPPSSI